MNIDNVKSKVKETIQELSTLEVDIQDDNDLYKDLGFRSVDAIKILLALEDCFEVSIDDVKFNEARSINKLVELIGDANG